MKVIQTIALLVTTLLVGCAISVKDGDDIQFHNHKIVSEFVAKSLPREQRLQRITSDIQKVGFKRVRVSGVFDTFSDSALSIFKHQNSIMTEHKTMLDNHRDVLSFLMANKGKDKAQLAQAIADFDKSASNEQEKIGPKIKEYERASQKISDENTKLTALITAQTLKLAHIIYSQGDDLLGVQGIQMLFNASKVNEAYNLAEIRLHLAKVANEFINDEKAIIDIAKQLQSLQDAD